VSPKLKEATWQRVGDDLHIVADSVHIVLDDPGGQVGGLLELLKDGGHGRAELTGTLGQRWPDIAAGDVAAALGELDRLGLLIDTDGDDGALTPVQRERFSTNLEFFANFASMGRGAESFQRAAVDAHVVFLGAGGLSCSVIPALAGLGVNHMTLLDFDVVELKNLNRQYLYRESDVGRGKVEQAAAWVRAFSPTVELRVLSRQIRAIEDVAGLLPGTDLLISGIDSPDGIDLMVNEACLAAGVPFVHGGISAREFSYGSVDPGRSACLACGEDARRDADPLIGELAANLGPINRTIGPAITALGGLIALEATRYLTGFTEPVAAGCDRFFDFTTGTDWIRRWDRRPGCPACASVPAGHGG
jgi:molybdopterin-synthase adenylyltransferase